MGPPRGFRANGPTICEYPKPTTGPGISNIDSTSFVFGGILVDVFRGLGVEVPKKWDFGEPRSRKLVPRLS
jgi:hypothetical protein